MELLDKLRSGELTLNQLTLDYGIKIREYDDRLVLNYDQVASDKHKFDPIVRVCRNLIIAKDYSRVLHRSFDRFFNLGEDPEGQKTFDFKRCVVEEKLDGSLIGMYHDGNDWCFCTRSMAFAEGEVDLKLVGINTYADVIKHYVYTQNLRRLANKDYSYIFELVGPYTRVVTPYKNTRLVLLGVRDKATGDYLDRREEAEKIEWADLPEEYSILNEEICRQCLECEMDQTFEGFVCVCAMPFNDELRVKIKNPRYVMLHHARTDGLTVNNIIMMVHCNEEEEYLSYFPDDRHLFEPYIKLRKAMPKAILETYNKYKDIEVQKDFAIAIKDIPYKDVLFNMRRNYALWHEKGVEMTWSDVRTDLLDLSEKRVVELYKLFADEEK